MKCEQVLARLGQAGIDGADLEREISVGWRDGDVVAAGAQIDGLRARRR